MQETRNNFWGSKICSTTLHQAKTGQHECRNISTLQDFFSVSFFQFLDSYLTLTLTMHVIVKDWKRQVKQFLCCFLSYKKVHNKYVAVIFRHSCLPVFAWKKVVLRFSPRSNCSEFLVSYGVTFQSVIKSFFKTPVFDALLFYCL